MLEQKPTCFFKYMSAATARVVLESGKVRYAAPPTLNDPFDAQLNLQFGFTVQELEKAMLKRYLDAINSQVPLSNQNNDFFVMLIELMRRNRHRLPSDEELAAELLPALQEGGATLEGNLASLHDGVRRLWLDDAKIFCVSEVCDAPLMWAHYSDSHRGVVIKILRDPKLDNLICAARKVQYRDDPPLVATLEEFVESNFNGKRLEAKDYWDKVFYTKHSQWSYEREWRVVVPGEAPGKPHSLFTLRPDEVGGVIFGSKLSEEDKSAITDLVVAKYPVAELQHAKLNPQSYQMVIEHAG